MTTYNTQHSRERTPDQEIKSPSVELDKRDRKDGKERNKRKETKEKRKGKNLE
jgi:hypothetical protein